MVRHEWFVIICLFISMVLNNLGAAGSAHDAIIPRSIYHVGERI